MLVISPSNDQLGLERFVLSSMVHVRWPLKWQGPDRASSLLPSPIFSAEGISLLLCREGSWATGFLCSPIRSRVKSSSSCWGLRWASCEQWLWRGVGLIYAARLVTFFEGKKINSSKTFTRSSLKNAEA